MFELQHENSCKIHTDFKRASRHIAKKRFLNSRSGLHRADKETVEGARCNNLLPVPSDSWPTDCSAE